MRRENKRRESVTINMITFKEQYTTYSFVATGQMNVLREEGIASCERREESVSSDEEYARAREKKKKTRRRIR